MTRRYQTEDSGMWRAIGVMLIACISFAHSARADDIEVYVNGTSSGATPNVMFLMDLSDSMNKTPTGVDPSSGNPSRLDILKLAVTQLLDDPDLPELNVGLGTFQGDYTTGPRFPVANLDDDANTIDPDIPAGTSVRDVLKFLIDDQDAWGRTPTVNNLLEMVRYFRSEPEPDTWLDAYGTWDAADNRYEDESGYRAPHPATYTGSFVNVDPSVGGYEADCEDYTMRSPPGANECADEEAEGLLMECQIYPERVCNSTTCDDDCGTEWVCTGTETYTEPSGCLSDSYGATWVTDTEDGEPSECCSASDAGGTECVSWLDYPSSCSDPLVEQCDYGRDRRVYRDCDIFYQDARVYSSPITQQCQKTALVVLTDGDPSVNTVDTGAVSGSSAQYPYDIRELIASADPTKSRDDIVCEDQSANFGASPGERPYGNCGPELAKFILDNDQVSTIPGSTVTTHTIGFGLSGPAASETWSYLQRIASAGGGGAYEANDLGSLVASFKSIITSVASKSQSFQSVATKFDTTRLQTSDRAFLPMFQPSDRRSWRGNLKGYYLRPEGLHDLQDRLAVTASSEGEVVFRPIAQSFWSTSSDGNDPLAGGFVNALSGLGRSIYTIADPTETSAVSLADGGHDFEIANPDITAALLGMPGTATAADRDALITWTRDAKVGAPLHTRPKVVDYGGATGSVLFFSTNQGMLHAVDVNAPSTIGDTAGGNELFAFIPHRLLGSLYEQSNNVVGANHIYGLDGDLSIWRQDLDKNGAIDGADKVYLYLGMRRGGNAYYAFDVTDPSDPILLWQIDPSTPGFAKLGQTWSGLQRAKVNDNGTERDVLVFGGGYDPAQDTAGTARAAAGDATGAGVYIVDAVSGVLLNSIGNNVIDYGVGVAGMNYSIPGNIRITDSDSNGIDDRLYFADMGSRLWRIDIKEGANLSVPSTIRGYMLADLGTDTDGNTTLATNRRFFYAPSVARVTRAGSLVYALSIGSGYRAHPLDGTISDKLFTIFDVNPTVGPPASTPSAIMLADTYDASANAVQTGATDADRTSAKSAMESASGWRIDLAANEKALARVKIFRNRLFATTFAPDAPADACSGANYTNRLYAMNLLDATPALPADVDQDGVIESGEMVRYQTVLDQAAILDEPTIITYHDEGNPNPAPGDPPTPPTTCNAIYAGAEQMMALCSAPVKVNWTKLR